LGDLAGALAAISTARAVYPSDERLVERQLHLLVAQGNIPAARALVAELPKTWRWLQWAGDLALRAGDAQAAVDDYSQAIQHFESVSAGLVDSYAKPISTRLHIARGHAHRQLGQIADAQADYAAAREGIPNDPLIDFNLGLTYALLGNLNRALECCRAALEASNAVLRAEIERDLQDPRYAELAQQLRTNNQ
jgi:tetratricopeptide (TPR) repeat protein